MASKRYVRHLNIWFAGILLLMMLFCYTLVVRQWYLTSAFLLVLIIAGIILLYRKIDSTNQRLTAYFKTLISGDTSLRLPEQNQGLGNDELNAAMNQLSQRIGWLEHSRRQEENLFKEMVQHLKAGIFLLDEEQRLVLANPVAQHFLNVRSAADRQMLEKRAPHFIRHLLQLQEKGQLMLEMEHHGEVQKWQLRHKAFQRGQERFDIFMVTNLQSELERKESEVTEKLLHTLTHEIMNSISPITSLIDTLQLMLDNMEASGNNVVIALESYNDLRTTARIIHKRGHGLVDFVERYGMLARLPRLNMERLTAGELLLELSTLMQEELARKQITLSTQLQNRNIIFRGDKQLLLQVLINLIKNAVEAYADSSGKIILTATKGDGYTTLSVFDKAGGVKPEIRKEIFLPFFTTKSKASGIGLSLSQNIVQAHNGRLYLKSHPEGSEFVVELAD